MPRPTAVITALLTAMTAAASVAVATPTAALAAISCDTSTTGGSTWYDGPSASRKYDARFSNSSGLPGLGTHTPQGAGTWWNWDGSGTNLILVSAYREGADSQIYGINPATGATVGVVAIAGGHVGGITTTMGWALVSGNGSTVRKYSLTALRDAMKAAGTPYLGQVGTAQSVIGASFLNSYGDSLFTGTFNETGRGQMGEYKVSSAGVLTRVGGTWEIPTKTQGIAITSGHFLYSTSYGRGNRSNIYAVRRGQTDLDAATLSCFRAPSMTEGITNYNGTTYLVYESGSHLYRSDSNTLNVITRMHKATTSSLTSLA